MASTYVNDLRLNEMATGDESGNWGNVTNTNLELIGEALGYGTEAITTNADTHTSTIADGATDPVRAMYVKYTGTLDSACTITIAPNTINRMQFIENGTSGSQNIIISQGSGANVTIPPGDVKAVYMDGAGSGAAVVDAFASLNVVDLKVEDDLTVTDDATIGGILDITDTTDASDATGDTGALRTEGGASIAKKLYVGTDLDVDGTANLDVVDIDGAVDMASTLAVAGTTTMSNASNATQLILQSTDADSSSGPVLELFRNSGSPADNDATGLIYFYGENDNDEKIAYTQIYNQVLDASDGTEDGSLQIYTMAAGTSTKTLTAEKGYVLIGTDSGDGFNTDAMLRIQRTGDRVFQQFKCDADQSVQILFGDVDDDVESSIQFHPANQDLRFGTGNNVEHLRILSDGTILQTADSQGSAFAVGTESTWNAFEIFQDRGVTNSASGIAFRSQSGTSPAGIVSVAGNTTGGVESLAFIAVAGNASTERMRIDTAGYIIMNPQVGSGNIDSQVGGVLNLVATPGAGNHSDALRIFYEHASTSGSLEARIKWYIGDDGTAHSYGNSGYIAIGKEGSYVTDDTRDSYMSFATQLNGSLSERGRITSGGDHLFNRTSSGFNNDGLVIGNSTGAYLYLERSISGNSVLYIHRRANDGELVSFYSENAQEGSISVSGATVSYNGFSGTHDSSGSGVSSSTAVGTVLSTIDEEHKADHAKVKVSDTASDKRVYGVLQTYKAAETNDTGNTVAEHAIVASVGIASVRVTGACAGGDLLESAGDGTARVQSDDIIRSSTLGKVTIGNSSTGEKMVSCVMYCG